MERPREAPNAPAIHRSLALLSGEGLRSSGAYNRKADERRTQSLLLMLLFVSETGAPGPFGPLPFRGSFVPLLRDSLPFFALATAFTAEDPPT